MIVFQRSVQLSTEGETDIVNITETIQQIVRESGVRTGLASISGKGSTLGITTVEYESGILADLRRALDQLAPPNQFYAHNARWGDENGSAHLRSALMGTSRSYPVTEALLRLGTWQQIVLCDFDDRPRNREITVTVMGTAE
ncbi:MAG: YjbQ family protein [Bryobacterales bacterium]|nr:YjbQ family protein [Bryobacterales bacterium]